MKIKDQRAKKVEIGRLSPGDVFVTSIGSEFGIILRKQESKDQRQWVDLHNGEVYTDKETHLVQPLPKSYLVVE